MPRETSTSLPLGLLGRVEEEISALLVTGLATQRGGRERLEALAGELSALKMERLATELRALAQGQGPTDLAGHAFTTLAMARKFRERLVPWPKVDLSKSVSSASDPAVCLILPEDAPDGSGISALVERLQSSNELARDHALAQLVQRGEDALPELARLAAKGSSVTMRREAIAAIEKIGGDTALSTLLQLLGDVHCWRALQSAILSYGERAVPRLTEIVSVQPYKKTQDRRRMAAALLYRLGGHEPLKGLVSQDEDAIVCGFALAAWARNGRGWEEPGWMVDGVQWNSVFLTAGVVALAKAEFTGDLGPAVESIDGSAVNDVRVVARWIGCGSSIELSLAEHYLAQLASGSRAKDRDRAASVLKGLAYPAAVPYLAGMVKSGETDPSAVAGILGETGGSSAIGLLLDMLRENSATGDALSALEELSDPGTALALAEILAGGLSSGAETQSRQRTAGIEHALASLGDGIADYLAAEMRTRRGTPVASSIQRALLQMKGPKAKKALEGTDVDSEEALLARLGQPYVSEGAVKALIRLGDAAVPGVEAVLAGDNIAAWRDAMSVLAGIAGPAAVDAVRKVVENRLPAASANHNASSSLCAQGIQVLSKRRVAGTAELYVQGLGTGAYEVQSAASAALAKIGQEVVPLVMPLLSSPKPEVRARTIGLLAKLKATEAEERGIALLSDSDWSVRSAATAALGEIAAATGSQRAVEALGTALLSRTLGMPWIAVKALEASGQRAAIPYLRKFAEIGQHQRAQAEEAIKKIEASAPPDPASGLAGKLRGFLRR